MLLLAGLLAAVALQAAAVDSATARRVATRFMERQLGRPLAGPLTDCSQKCGLNETRLFTAADGGFVLVAGDNRVMPVLAYSPTSGFDPELPEEVADWLRGYEQEIVRLRTHGVEASDAVREQWRELLEREGDTPLYATVVSPMLTTLWTQGALYSKYCPRNGTTATKAGCVAIALAQLMKYWNHPLVGEGSYSYTSGSYGVQSANFGATTYDWANMPNSVSSVTDTNKVNAVATLVYHAGVSVGMSYGTGSSSATTTSTNSLTSITGERALRTYFRYAKSLHSMRKECMGDSVWMALLDAELAVGRPVIYSGRDVSGGHAFVCDGRDNAGHFHFNWGWGSSYNGYYAIGALNPAPGGAGGNATSHYNMENRAIVGIYPDTNTLAACTLSAVPDVATHGSVSGSGTYAYGDTLTLTAQANAGYRFARWSDGMCYNPRQIIVGGDITYTAVYEPVAGDVLQYDNGLYYNSWGYSSPQSYYWGTKFEASMLGSHTHLDSVMVYLKGGTYQLRVYNGNTPSASNMLAADTFATTGDGEWFTRPMVQPVALNNALPLWIVLYNDDTPYAACTGTYSGSHYAAYANTNGSNWSTTTVQRTFLIRAGLSTQLPPPPVYYTVTAVSEDEATGTVAGGGQYEEGHTATLLATAGACHAFSQWSDGSTENPRQVVVASDTAFTAQFTTVTLQGTAEDVEACDEYLWNGATYTVPGTYTYSTLSAEDCDSVATLQLTLHHSTGDTLEVVSLNHYVWNGTDYDESGTYLYSGTTVHGCDSLVTLVLTVEKDTVGISGVASGSLVVSPNPTSGWVWISGVEVAKVLVYSMEGRLLYAVERPQGVDLSALPAGVYLLEVHPDTGCVERVKVVRQ